MGSRSGLLKKVAAGSHSEKPATNSRGRLISQWSARALRDLRHIKGRPADIDGDGRLMSLIPEQSITAMGGEAHRPRA